MSFIHRVKSFFYPLTNNSYITNSQYVNGLLSNDLLKRQRDGKLLDQGYVKNAHLYSINRRVGEKGSEIPILVKVNGEIVEEGPAWDLIYKQKNISKVDFINNEVITLNTTGDLFWWMPSVLQMTRAGISTIPTTIEPLNPGGVVINFNESGDVVSYDYNNGFIQRKEIPAEEVLHVKLFDPTLFGITSGRGLSPLQAAYCTLVANNNGQVAHASTLKNGGVKGIISSSSGGEGLNAMTPDEETEIQGVMSDKFGSPGKFNSIYTTKATIDYTAIGSNPSDLQILESNVVDLRTFCNIYGAPSEIFNDGANKIQNTVKIAQRSFLENGIIPITQKPLRGLTHFLQGIGLDWSYELDTKDLLVFQEEQKEKAEKNKIVTDGITALMDKVQLGAMTIDQAKNTLVKVWGIDEDEVKEILG